MDEQGQFSLERAVGQLKGEMAQVNQTVAWLVYVILWHNARMEQLGNSHTAMETKNRIGWRIMAGVAIAGSFGGATAHQLFLSLIEAMK